MAPKPPIPLETLGSVERLAVLSDIHLGRGDGTTGFDGDADRLCTMLDAVAARVDLVVINGDLYDLDRGALPLAQGLEYRTIRETWQRVETCISEHGMRVTAGNHDHVLRDRPIGAGVVRMGYRVRVGALDVRIEHGERFDSLVKRNRQITSLFTWMSGQASRAGMRPLYRALRWVEQRATDDASYGLERRAGRWLDAHGDVDVFVIGHTHRRYGCRIGERWVLNPGQCMCAPPQFLVLDGGAREARFAEIDETGGVRVLRRLALDDAIRNTEPIDMPRSEGIA